MGNVHFLLALGAAVLAVSCSKKEGPIDGIGSWHIGKTRAREGTICQPQ